METINPDNLNQLTMQSFTSKTGVDILNMYWARKKESSWSLLMVLCLKHALPSLHTWKRGFEMSAKIEWWEYPWKNLNTILSSGRQKALHGKWVKIPTKTDEYFVSAKELTVKVSEGVNAILSQNEHAVFYNLVKLQTRKAPLIVHSRISIHFANTW